MPYPPNYVSSTPTSSINHTDVLAARVWHSKRMCQACVFGTHPQRGIFRARQLLAQSSCPAEIAAVRARQRQIVSNRSIAAVYPETEHSGTAVMLIAFMLLRMLYILRGKWNPADSFHWRLISSDTYWHPMYRIQRLGKETIVLELCLMCNRLYIYIYSNKNHTASIWNSNTLNFCQNGFRTTEVSIRNHFGYCTNRKSNFIYCTMWKKRRESKTQFGQNFTYTPKSIKRNFGHSATKYGHTKNKCKFCFRAKTFLATISASVYFR